MKTKTYSFTCRHYDACEELSDTDRELVTQAEQASGGAYAPYSGFRVGAAVRLRDGELLTASNQESVVFPSGMCAERVLLYHVQAARAGAVIEAMAVVSRAEVEVGECYPCGACRQVMLDTQVRQGRPFRVLMCGVRSVTEVASVEDLLPFAFK